MKSTLLLTTPLLLVASAVSAATQTPLIPTNISTSCSTFLTSLNTDSTLSTCLSPLVTLVKAAAASTSTAALTTSLNSLCTSSTAGCTDTAIRAKLTSFYTACSAELVGDSTSSSTQNLYDLLYVMQPMKEVICLKNSTSSSYCVTSLSGSTSTTLTNSTLTTKSSNVSIPASTSWKTASLPYLFLQTTTAEAALCGECSTSMFKAYAAWEAAVPYANGLANSPILGAQEALWKAAESTCGSTFTTTIATYAVNKSATNSISTGSTTTSGASISHQSSAAALVLAITMAGTLALLQ